GGPFLLTDLAEDRKSFQQPHTHLVDAAGQERNPGQNEQRAHRLLYAVKVMAKAREKGREGLDRKGGNNERDSEPQRVDRKQARTLGHRVLRRRDGQDGGENWPDARRPSERKSESDDIGTPEADRFGDIQPLLTMQQRDRGNTEKMQAHDDDDDAGDGCEWT